MIISRFREAQLTRSSKLALIGKWELSTIARAGNKLDSTASRSAIPQLIGRESIEYHHFHILSTSHFVLLKIGYTETLVFTVFDRRLAASEILPAHYTETADFI